MRFDDNDDEPFDWDDDGFGENHDPFEIPRELEAENQRIENLPILRKAREVLEVTQAIVATINQEEDVLMMHEQMVANAMILAPKVVGAEGADLYTLRMENAVLIRIHARDLLAQTDYCEAEQLTDAAYLDLLRDEIDSFRQLFVEWINGFDKKNDALDEWGLFC